MQKSHNPRKSAPAKLDDSTIYINNLMSYCYSNFSSSDFDGHCSCFYFLLLKQASSSSFNIHGSSKILDLSSIFLTIFIQRSCYRQYHQHEMWFISSMLSRHEALGPKCSPENLFSKKPAHAFLHKNLILIKGTPRRKLADPGPTHWTVVVFHEYFHLLITPMRKRNSLYFRRYIQNRWSCHENLPLLKYACVSMDIISGISFTKV